MGQVFLSYAHDDDSVLNEGSRGWVTFFRDALEKEISESGKSNSLEIWRDKERLRHGDLNDKLKAALDESACILSIGSPLYIQRPICQAELGHFVENKDAQCVVIAVKRPFDATELPDSTQNSITIEFFDWPQKNRPRLFFQGDEQLGLEFDIQYWSKILDVVEALDEVTGVVEQDAKATVYLSLTASEFSYERTRIKQELKNAGYKVVPKVDLPQHHDALERIAADAARKADFAIHLLSAAPALLEGAPDDAMNIDEVQLKATATRIDESEDFVRFVWPAGGSYTSGHARRDRDHVLEKNEASFVMSTMNEIDRHTATGSSIDEGEAGVSTVRLICLRSEAAELKPVSQAASRIGASIEPIFFEDIPDSSPGDGVPWLIGWGDTPLAEIKAQVIDKLVLFEEPVGLLKLRPDSAEQVLYEEGRLDFVEDMPESSDQLQSLLIDLIEG